MKPCGISSVICIDYPAWDSKDQRHKYRFAKLPPGTYCILFGRGSDERLNLLKKHCPYKILFQCEAFNAYYSHSDDTENYQKFFIFEVNGTETLPGPFYHE